MFTYLFTTNPILIIAAIVPAVYLMVKIYKTDKLESEPIKLLLKLVGMGILATIGAALIETVLILIIELTVGEESLLGMFLTYFLVVAYAEEGCKYLLTKKMTWKSPEFNCTFDGVVYAAFVSLGFALWENIGYVAQYGIGTAAIRALTAVPGHCCFGVFMGLFYGLAKRYEYAGDLDMSKKYRKYAVVVPAAIHGAYDFIASVNWDYSFFLFIAFVIAMFVVALKMIKKAEAGDTYIGQPMSQPRMAPDSFQAGPVGDPFGTSETSGTSSGSYSSFDGADNFNNYNDKF